MIENYREGKKVKHRTISNLTKWPEDLISNFNTLLKGKKITNVSDLEFSNGKSFGALKVILEVSKRLGISQALGNTRQAKLALLQIAGRIMSQGSRNYIANEWSKNQAVEDLLKLSNFNEDSLYRNLDWLTTHQAVIEKNIFTFRYKDQPAKEIFLYDVTSSYFEGEKNELASYGYNRDKKRGKKQIVVGLMVDSYGYPLTIEVFKGNTNDTKTVSSQLEKLKEEFGVERVIFVGDKGMVKSNQIDEIISEKYKWNYLTSITKQQINTLINKGIIELSLFDEDVIEVEGENSARYILRKNKYRAEALEQNRASRINCLKKFIKDQNTYLKDHPKAKLEVAKRKANEKSKKLKLSSLTEINAGKRKITLRIKKEKLAKESELDGCYVIKTDVPKEVLDKQTAHDRYKDLSKVEFAFRTMKTTMEEIRPIFVRKEDRTRGHVLVVMLAYMIIKYITDKIEHLDCTRKFAIESLDKIQYINYLFEEKKIKVKPKHLSQHQAEILAALDIRL